MNKTITKITTTTKKSMLHHDNFRQSPLFTIITLKIYLNMTYREISDFVSFNGKLKRYLCNMIIFNQLLR